MIAHTTTDDAVKSCVDQVGVLFEELYYEHIRHRSVFVQVSGVAQKSLALTSEQS